MPTGNLITFKDAVDHVIDWLGADPSEQNKRDARRSVLNAYREVAQAHTWSYFYQRGRLITNAQQTAGTIKYEHSSGSLPRLVTLTGASWPTWAFLGDLSITSVPYEIDQVVNSSQVTLTNMTNPGVDLAAGTAYTLYQDTYTLPIDFMSMDTLINMTNLLYPEYVHPSDWVARQRLAISPATPRIFTITGSPDYIGAMALRFYPPADQAYNFDYIYRRKARQMFIDEYSTGTASIAANSLTVTGSGTSWTSKMAGSTIRFSANATDFPRGIVYNTPYLFERIVEQVVSATQLTIDVVPDQTLTGVKYVISDQVDMEEGGMINCFLRCCERQATLTRKMDPKLKQSVEADYRTALIEARETDSRYMGQRASGGDSYGTRLAWMPRGADIP